MSEQQQVVSDDYDPFEAFDDVIGGDLRDPYPDLAEKKGEDAGMEGQPDRRRHDCPRAWP